MLYVLVVTGPAALQRAVMHCPNSIVLAVAGCCWPAGPLVVLASKVYNLLLAPAAAFVLCQLLRVCLPFTLVC